MYANMHNSSHGSAVYHVLYSLVLISVSILCGWHSQKCLAFQLCFDLSRCVVDLPKTMSFVLLFHRKSEKPAADGILARNEIHASCSASAFGSARIWHASIVQLRTHRTQQ